MSFQNHTWLTSYATLEDNPVEDFYIPALSEAVRYDRISGYFSAKALFFASRGLRQFIENDGRMRLLLSCELSEVDVKAIEDGYDLRQKIEEKLVAVPLEVPDLEKRQGLLALTYMISRSSLDVRIAIRLVERRGRLVHDLFSILHDKMGLLYDAQGNTISFKGSNNESAAGWVSNSEGFSVSLSWEGGRERERVEKDRTYFERLWAGQIDGLQTLEFPEALKARLLRVYPPEEYEAILAGRRPGEDLPTTDLQSDPPLIPDPLAPPDNAFVDPEEERRAVWRLIRTAAAAPDGLAVGYRTAAVTPWPHQLRNLKRMAEPESIRILVCDEVGLGKTITAGLAIRQLHLSGKASRILILVPAGVIPQWQNELYEKFNLNVPVYDGNALRYRRTHGTDFVPEKKIGRTEWMELPIVITSSHLMRRKERQGDFDAAADWDLILLDEAHHARRQGAGSAMEKGPNTLLTLMTRLKDRTRSLILATATPMQVHPVEVWDLLNLLGLPPSWDRRSFEEYFELLSGNPSHESLVRLATLFRATEDFYGPVTDSFIEATLPTLSIVKRKVILEALRNETSTIPLRQLQVPDRKAVLKILQACTPVQRLMARHTRILLKEYFKRGLIQSRIAERDVTDVAIEMPATERALYEMVENYISETYNRTPDNERNAVGFVMTIYRKRLASSYRALYRTLEKRLSKAGILVEEDMDDDLRFSQDEETLSRLLAGQGAQSMMEEEVVRIKEIMKTCSQLSTSKKTIELERIIAQAFSDGYSSAIIFTQFTDTLEYLKEFLSERFDRTLGTYYGDGGATKTPNQEWKKRSREQIKEEFLNGKIDLLICSDAAAEGLNLQTCGVLINYDLPWNPMKVEQRIGRIDRIGQKYDTMRIFNLAYKDTVESDIYFSLAQRIHLFQGIVGRLQPILSILPEEMARLALMTKEERELAREELFHRIELQKQEAEADAFDLDEISADSMEVPEMPETTVTLEFLSHVMNSDTLRPPQVEWIPLDRGSYEVHIPGRSPRRVTFDPELFEFHNENMDLFSHGNILFEATKALVAD